MSDDNSYFVHADGRRSPYQLSPLRKRSPSIGTVTDAILTVKAIRDASLGCAAEADRDGAAISEAGDSTMSDYCSKDIDKVLTAAVAGSSALVSVCSSPPPFHGCPSSTLASAGNFLSPPCLRAVPHPDSLDTQSSELPLSAPSSPPPQRLPRKAATKASTAPRERVLNLSSAQQQIFQTYFKKAMTNGSSRTLKWRKEVQTSTGLSMQQVNVYI